MAFIVVTGATCLLSSLLHTAFADIVGRKHARMSLKGQGFDLNGYDQYGYDAFGFDKDGYDVYGRPVTDEFAGKAEGV